MPENHGVASSIGLPAAVRDVPGFENHLDKVKTNPRGANIKMTRRSAQRGVRLSRKARSRD